VSYEVDCAVFITIYVNEAMKWCTCFTVPYLHTSVIIISIIVLRRMVVSAADICC